MHICSTDVDQSEQVTDPFCPVFGDDMTTKKGGETRALKARAYLREEKAGAATFRDLYEWRKPSYGHYVAPENIHRRFELHLLPLVGHHTADTLLPEHLEAAFELLADKPLQPEYLNKIRGDGLRLIRDAIANRRWDGGNPFEVLKPRRIVQKDYATLTLDEAARVLASVREDMQNLFALAIYLGPRKGEIFALRVSDVDLNRRTIDFCRSHGRDTTKTGRARRGIPIPDELLPYIEDALKKAKTDLVFARDEAGSRYRFDFNLTRVLANAMKMAGVVQHWKMVCRRKWCGFSELSKSAIESYCVRCNMRLWAVPTPRRLRFYDLRHTAASLHESAGCKPIAYKKALGWAAQDVSEKTYVHLTPEEFRHELNKMSLNNTRQKPTTTGQNQERRKGLEPSTPSLGRTRRNGRTQTPDNSPTTKPDPKTKSITDEDNRPHLGKRYISVAELAERWGVSTDYLYKSLEAGRIYHIRLGSLIRIDVEWIEAREKLGGIQ